jgi:hypothetical protein
MTYDNDNCDVCGCVIIEAEEDTFCLNGACPTNEEAEDEKGA